MEGINDSAPLWDISDLIIDCGDAGDFAGRLREIALPVPAPLALIMPPEQAGYSRVAVRNGPPL